MAEIGEGEFIRRYVPIEQAVSLALSRVFAVSRRPENVAPSFRRPWHR